MEPDTNNSSYPTPPSPSQTPVNMAVSNTSAPIDINAQKHNRPSLASVLFKSYRDKRASRPLIVTISTALIVVLLLLGWVTWKTLTIPNDKKPTSVITVVP